MSNTTTFIYNIQKNLTTEELPQLEVDSTEQIQNHLLYLFYTLNFLNWVQF